METKLLEIDELGTGDYFGVDHQPDGSAGEEPIPYSVITVIPTEVFVLDMHDYFNMNERIIDFIRDKMRVSSSGNVGFPSDTEIR